MNGHGDSMELLTYENSGHKWKLIEGIHLGDKDNRGCSLSYHFNESLLCLQQIK